MLIQDLSARRQLVKEIAAELRSLHKVGGVVVMFVEEHECPFGFAMASGVENVVLAALPSRLREIASHLEAGVTLTPESPKVS